VCGAAAASKPDYFKAPREHARRECASTAKSTIGRNRRRHRPGSAIRGPHRPDRRGGPTRAYDHAFCSSIGDRRKRDGSAAVECHHPRWPREKLHCISYAPFAAIRAFGPVYIDPGKSKDLASSSITDCVRTYSIDLGSNRKSPNHGMKVLQGLWLSNRPDRAACRSRPRCAGQTVSDVIVAVVVGGEVLLRRKCRVGPRPHHPEVEAQVSMLITYADVWEFWLRLPDRRGG
jgi:hypothetical protein